MSQTHSSLTLSRDVVDRLGHSLRFCYLEFDRESISDGFMVHYCVLGESGEIDFKGF